MKEKPPGVREITEEDRDLMERVRRLEEGSLDAIESGAREILLLVTTLLGAMAGLLASGSLPGYMFSADVRILSALAAISFFVSVIAAIQALLPKRYEHGNDLVKMRELVREIPRRKEKSLRTAHRGFLAGMFMLLLLILDILLKIN
jgi:hypothetical protein